MSRLPFVVVLSLLFSLPLTAQLQIDTVTNVDTLTPTASQATVFSTSEPNEVVLAFIGTGSSPGSKMTVSNVSGAGLTWTLTVRANTSNGTSEIWRALATNVVTNGNVSATYSQVVASSITIISIKGADVSGTNGSGAIGVTATGSASSGAPSASITTTRTGSMVFGVGNDWDGAVSRTIGSGQSLIHQFLGTQTGDTFWVQSWNGTIGSSGMVVTINDTAPQTDRWNLGVIEIKAAGLPTPNPTPSPTPTPTPAPTPTPTPSPTPTPAPTPTPTPSPTPTATPTPTPAPTPSPSPSPGVIFSDAFDGTSLDTTKWTPMNRCGDISHQQELERLTPAQCSVGGGSLSLTAQPNGGIQCKDFNLDGTVRSTHQTTYDSCMVQSASFNFMFGTLEFDVLSTNPGLGTWPGSLWLEGADCQASNVGTADVNGSGIGSCNWPNVGSEEIDPCEIKSSDTQPNTMVHQNSFSTTGIGSLGQEFSSTTPWSDPTVNWHHCKIVWTTDSLTFFVDGNQTQKLLKADGDPVPQGPLFILINVAIGGQGSSTPAPSDFPQTMHIKNLTVSQP